MAVDGLPSPVVDVEAPAGPSTLQIHSTLAGSTRDLSRTVEIHEAHYEREFVRRAAVRLSGPDALKIIEEEVKLKDKVFAASAPQPLWSVTFAHLSPHSPRTASAPAHLQGKLAAFTRAWTFARPRGTPVKAANSGTVVLAASFTTRATARD